jgi:hypothetical protein
MSREIMQQAFDAFEDLKAFATDNGAMPENWDAYYPKQYDALEALRQALAQPEQEPVAWMVLTQDDKKLMLYGEEKPPIFDAPVKLVPLYTAPLSKPWVGLTDDEINDFDKKLRDNGDYCSLHFAWGISAKLKEKNGG